MAITSQGSPDTKQVEAALVSPLHPLRINRTLSIAQAARTV